MKEREVIEKQGQQLLNDYIIQPSSNPWVSPVVLAKKEDGTLSFCLDYGQLSEDVYTLLRIDASMKR